MNATPALVAVGLAGLVACAGSVPRKTETGGPVSAVPDSARNMVVLEFRDSPTQGLLVRGGMLAVPDSSGRFGRDIVRYQPSRPNSQARGFGDGDRLVFTDLESGTYRVALVNMEESGTVHRFITKKSPERFSETCRVYSDTIPQLTFSVRAGEVRYLGRLVRRLRPAGSGAELWQTSFSWEAVDEARAVRDLIKSRRVVPWRGLLTRHLARLDSLGSGR